MKEKLKEIGKVLIRRPAFYLFIITIFALLIFFYKLNSFDVLPTKYIGLAACICVVIFIICVFVWYKFHDVVIQISPFKVITVFVCSILCITSCFGAYYVSQVVDTLNEMSTDSTKVKKVITVYSLKSSAVQEEKDLEGRTIGVLQNSNRENVDICLSKFTGKVTTKDYTSSITMFNEFKGQAIDCICVDQSILATVEEYDGFEDLEDLIHEVYSYTYYIEKEDTADSVDVTKESFTVLISGIDTRSNSFDDPDSRSDVNLLVTVNPKTHQVFLLSIPRDYYVTTVCDAADGCAVGKKDKLTHTGWHGVSTTEKTIENFMGIDINYNVRVRFDTVIELVDLLDGIDVYSDQTISNLGNGNSTCTVVAGNNHLDGECALAFARERYAYASGDRQRGKNQIQIVTAVMEKMLSTDMLTNFTSIMSKMSDLVQTNMNTSDITSLVKQQLENGGSWTVTMYSLDGETGTGYAYELEDYASVVYPDEATIQNAQEDIQSVINGDTPPYVNQTKTIG